MLKQIDIKLFLLAGIVSSLFLGLLFHFYLKEDPIATEVASLRGRMMPATSLVDVETRRDLSEFVADSEEVLLIYAVSSCEACKRELKYLSNEKDSKSDKKIFAVMFENKRAIMDYKKENKINIPILHDESGRMLEKLELKYFPANLKLSKGEIMAASFGFPKNPQDLMSLFEN